MVTCHGRDRTRAGAGGILARLMRTIDSRPWRALATFLVLATALVACSSSGSTATSTTVPRRKTDLHATVGTVEVVSPRPMVEFTSADRDAVLAVVEQYVHDATIAPIDGDRPGNLTALLAPTAVAATTGTDGDALADTGVPHAVGKVDAKLAPVDMTALVDENGTIHLVGATLDLTVAANATAGSFSIHRSGELMLVRDGDGWKILGFTLVVNRDGPGLGSGTSTTTGSVP
jgi:hypothetical protein